MDSMLALYGMMEEKKNISKRNEQKGDFLYIKTAWLPMKLLTAHSFFFVSIQMLPECGVITTSYKNV